MPDAQFTFALVSSRRVVGGVVSGSAGGTMKDRRSDLPRSLCLAFVVLVVTAAGCGASSKSSSTPNTISAGQVNIQLPPGWKVTSNGAVRPQTAATGTGATAPGSQAATGDTVPLAKANPTTKFFGALECLPVVPGGPEREVHRRSGRVAPELPRQ